MQTISLQTLQHMWPNAPHQLVVDFCAMSPEIFAKYGLNTDRRLKHFMGQISTETSGGSLPGMRESMNYSHAERIVEVFGAPHSSAGVTMQEAVGLVHNAKALAMRVYGPTRSPHLAHMLGNIKDEDGWDFRGGGLLQNTGRAMYDHLSKLTGIDLIGSPDLINDTKTNIACAVIEFCQPATLQAADNDNVQAVSKCVNGGTNGLHDRIVWTANWGKALGA